MTVIAAPIGASLVFWVAFAAMVGCFGCIDAPLGDPEPVAKVFAHWDPLACGGPHRVVIDLEDDGGAPLASSAPCSRGGVTLDVSHWGNYRGRVYAWLLDEPPRSVTPVTLTIDATVVHWQISTPP